MLKVNVHKAEPKDPSKREDASKSVSIIIDKQWTGPNPRGMTQAQFFKAQDHEFHVEAMAIADALTSSLPRATFERLLGILLQMHAVYLTTKTEVHHLPKEG